MGTLPQPIVGAPLAAPAWWSSNLWILHPDQGEACLAPTAALALKFALTGACPRPVCLRRDNIPRNPAYRSSPDQVRASAFRRPFARVGGAARACSLPATRLIGESIPPPSLRAPPSQPAGLVLRPRAAPA